MTRTTIDSEKLRVQIRGLSRENLLALLDRAIDLLPKTKLTELVDGHLPLDALLPDDSTTASLLGAVKAFDAASRHGEYFEDFHVNSKNFMDMSCGTQRWIAECERLLEQATRQAAEHPDAELPLAFELIFGLLDRIDEGEDDIVFFADEGGSWQVGVDWKGVLPAYARCLSLTSAPEAFAESVLGLINRHAAHDAKKLLPAIRQVASPEQVSELDRQAKASKRLR